jgi:hypothetical protein
MCLLMSPYLCVPEFKLLQLGDFLKIKVVILNECGFSTVDFGPVGFFLSFLGEGNRIHSVEMTFDDIL